MGVSENHIREAFNKIKEEMSDHLESINENTNELNAQSDILLRIEQMMYKLSERIDDLELKIEEKTKTKIAPILLSSKEHEIFILLYSKNGSLLSVREIARTTGYTEHKVTLYINKMQHKKIPIIRKLIDDCVYFNLAPSFCNLQAKKSIIRKI